MWDLKEYKEIDFNKFCTQYVRVKGKVQSISDNHFTGACTATRPSLKQSNASTNEVSNRSDMGVLGGIDNNSSKAMTMY